jgi:hypothetical protein
MKLKDKWRKVMKGVYEREVSEEHWFIDKLGDKCWRLRSLNKPETVDKPIRIDTSKRNLMKWVSENQTMKRDDQ